MKMLLSLALVCAYVMANEPTNQEVEERVSAGLEKINSFTTVIIGDKAKMTLHHIEDKKCTQKTKESYVCTFTPYITMSNGETNASKSQETLFTKKDGKWTTQAVKK